MGVEPAGGVPGPSSPGLVPPMLIWGRPTPSGAHVRMRVLLAAVEPVTESLAATAHAWEFAWEASRLRTTPVPAPRLLVEPAMPDKGW